MAELNQIANYLNNMLQSYEPASSRLPIQGSNLIDQIHDGVLLCCLANAISDKGEVIPVKSIKFEKATLFHKMDNVNKSLQAFKSLNINIINIRSEFIVQKAEKSVIGLFNQLTRQKPAPKKEQQPIQDKPIYTQKQQEPPQQTQIQQQIHNNSTQQEQQYIEQYEEKSIPVNVNQSKIPENSQIFINMKPLYPEAAHAGYKFQQTFGPSILVLKGSLRKMSLNKAIIQALEDIKNKQFFDKIHFHHVDLSVLPLYNEDLVRQGKIPQAIHDLKTIITKVNGIIIASPQYNFSITPIIKNVLDWLTLTKNENSVLANKKIGLVGASYINEGALLNVKKVCQLNKANVFEQLFYVSLKSKSFDPANAKLVAEEQIDRLSLWYQDFGNFVLSGKDKPEPVPRFIY